MHLEMHVFVVFENQSNTEYRKMHSQSASY